MRRDSEVKYEILAIFIAVTALSCLPAPSALANVRSADVRQDPGKDISQKLELAKSYKAQSSIYPNEPLYFNEAVRLYGEVLASDPGNKEALADMAEVYTVKGDSAKAGEFYGKLEEIDKKFAASRKAEAARAASRAAAAAGLPQAAETPADKARAKLELAKSYKAQSSIYPNEPLYFNEAVRLYGEVLASDPGNKEALADMAEVYTVKGDSAKAGEFYGKLEEIDKKFAASRKAEAARAASRAAAAAALPQAAETPADKTRAKLELARSYKAQSVVYPEEPVYSREAFRLYQEVLASDPGNKEALADMAEMYAKSGQLPMAQELYSKLKKIDAKFAEAKEEAGVKDAAKKLQMELGLAASYVRQALSGPQNEAMLDTAFQRYADILKANPGQKDAMRGQAAIYTYRNNFAEAEKIFNRLIEADPKSAQDRLDLGFLYYTTGAKDKAFDTAMWVLSRESDNGRARLLKAVILEERNELGPALAEYQASLQAAHKARDIRLVLPARLGLGRAYEKANLYFDAMTHYELVARIAPALAEGHLETARLALKLGMPDKAIPALEALIAKRTEEPRAHVMLGMARLMKGDYEGALASFRKAEALGVTLKKELISAVEQKLNETRKKAADEKST